MSDITNCEQMLVRPVSSDWKCNWRYGVRFFSTKQLHLLILCTFSRFGVMCFGESGLNRTVQLPEHWQLWQAELTFIHN